MTTLDRRSPEAQFGRSVPSQSSRSRRTTLRIQAKEIVETADSEYNESSLPFRQRTNSTASFDTIRIRSTAATIPPTKFKNDTDVVIAEISTPHTRSPSPTSSSCKQGSKQKIFFQFIPTQPGTTSSLSLCTASVKSPRNKKRSKKSGIGPVPKLPTIFNVGQLPGLVTLPTSTTVTISQPDLSLDDISSWTMDTLPTIPSPPNSPITRSNTITPTSPNAILSHSAPSDAPFSTPYDEDALLDNEIPFPFNKHSGVIIENMGIKKAKNLNKGKESLLNRHITTVEPEFHPHSSPTLPLTLPSPSRNTTDFNQLAGITLPHTTTPKIPVAGPSSWTKDAWGCIHLGADDYEPSIAFPQTSHFEVWDMDDEAFFACPLFLFLMAKDPRLWNGTPIALPDVSLIDIRCDDLPVPSTMSVYDPNVEYSVQCTAPQNMPWNRTLPPHSSSQKTGASFLVDPDEITLERKWERTYTRPKWEGYSQTQVFRIADRHGDEDGTMNGRGWYLKFWIPIPARLFLKRETRIFEIRASVWMMSMRGAGEERKLEQEDEEDFPLIAEAEMSVSHLRRERLMMM